MLKIQALKKRYKKFEVLRGLDMNIEKGDVYGFLGKNGCGKTTTMNIICNIITKDSGRLIFSDNNVKIGYLTETPALYGYMDGYEYLRYIAACCEYSGDVNRRVGEVLDVVGMTEGARRRVKGYSRGMTQRLGIAAALFDSPELLILDEPTSALDPEGRSEVMNIIQRLKAGGTTIILCTHIITDVERVANKIGIMRNGVIAEEGYIDEVVARHRSHSSQIVVRLSEALDAEEKLVFATSMSEMSEVTGSFYNDKMGQVILNSSDPEKLYDDLISLIYEKKIKVSELTAQKTTLEDVYLSVTGLRGGAQV